MSAENAEPKKKSGLVIALVAGAFALGAIVAAALLVNIAERKQEARNSYVKLVEVTENDVDPAKWGTNWPREVRPLGFTNRDSKFMRSPQASPSIRAAKRAAVSLVQRMVLMPQSAQAKPIMAVTSPAGSRVLTELSSGRTPTIISKTSIAAHSKMFFQLGSKAIAVGAAVLGRALAVHRPRERWCAQ